MRWTAWCEINILRNLKRKCGGHGILHPHCLKNWGDTSPCTPSNCAHGQISIWLPSLLLIYRNGILIWKIHFPSLCCSGILEIQTCSEVTMPHLLILASIRVANPSILNRFLVTWNFSESSHTRVTTWSGRGVMWYDMEVFDLQCHSFYVSCFSRACTSLSNLCASLSVIKFETSTGISYTRSIKHSWV